MLVVTVEHVEPVSTTYIAQVEARSWRSTIVTSRATPSGRWSPPSWTSVTPATTASPTPSSVGSLAPLVPIPSRHVASRQERSPGATARRRADARRAAGGQPPRGRWGSSNLGALRLVRGERDPERTRAPAPTVLADGCPD